MPCRSRPARPAIEQGATDAATHRRGRGGRGKRQTRGAAGALRGRCGVVRTSERRPYAPVLARPARVSCGRLTLARVRMMIFDSDPNCGPDAIDLPEVTLGVRDEDGEGITHVHPDERRHG